VTLRVGGSQDPAFAAFAVGLIGISQIPGRAVFALAAARVPRPLAIEGVFAHDVIAEARSRGAFGVRRPSPETFRGASLT
jgi:hypothetical protein